MDYSHVEIRNLLRDDFLSGINVCNDVRVFNEVYKVEIACGRIADNKFFRSKLKVLLHLVAHNH